MRWRGEWLVVVAAVLSGGARASAEEVRWRTDPAAALQEAQKRGRPVLYDFGTLHCVWCDKLDQTTFRDAAVAKQLNEQFVPVKVSAQRDPALVARYHVESFPTLIAAAPDGTVLARRDDYADAAQMKQILASALAKMPAPAAAPAAGGQARATELLRLARQDFEGRCYMACLERCRVVTSSYPDLPEAQQARALAKRITDDAETRERASARLRDSLGELYLRKAEELARAGDESQAAEYARRVILVSPASAWARAAGEMLRRLRPAETVHKPGAGVYRGQMQ
jgi:thiol-disulfide isomerase/thioredoxin